MAGSPPAGEMPICNNLGDQNYKFTGKERDAESGLDDFGEVRFVFAGALHE